ncbi:MAG: Asp-tRNA(Asn)/Glu-tRNA(Gln) amidotransferase subunit GatC [Ignavibacteria bacterium]|nr:Asp-tRNA(Asn)/Glu-tRNA(Gln) amidotransferase subunit GatC [Ignavibacteria bacterium]
MQSNGEINSETVKRIADLSRLSFTDSEIEAFAEEFSGIVRAIDDINSMDLTGMEPMSHVLDLPNVFREDVPSESLSVKQALENAPSNNETFFKVPKVME